MSSLNQNDDLIIQIKRLIGITNSIVERYARSFEEFDGTRLALEEIRAILNEVIEEIALSRNADTFWRKRLEQLAIADKMGDVKTVNRITQEITGEHLRDWLCEQIADNQNQLRTHTRNVSRVKMQIAKQGYATVEQENNLDDYGREIDHLTEALERMRNELKALDDKN